jgi:hypothetical protein
MCNRLFWVVLIASVGGCSNNDQATAPHDLATEFETTVGLETSKRPPDRREPVRSAEHTPTTAVSGEAKTGTPSRSSIGTVEKLTGPTVELFATSGSASSRKVNASDLMLPLPVLEEDSSTLRFKVLTKFGVAWLEPSDILCCVRLHKGSPPSVLEQPAGTAAVRGVATVRGD